MPLLADGLPELYRALLPDALNRRHVPTETKATCASCAMCKDSAPGAVEPVDGVNRLFRPDTKCCTYYPRLPNYLVGALLADETAAMAEGRRRVADKIHTRVGITPMWVKPTGTWRVLYDNARNAFGRASALRCPYFDKDSGACTIWAYREAVCSTFFCKYVAGEDGRRFWTSTKRYLALVEAQLARYAVLDLLPDYVYDGRDRAELTANAPLGPEELDERPPPDAEYADAWAEWTGREPEFYRECYARIRKLTAADVSAILGLDGTIAVATLERHLAEATDRRLPRALKLNPAATVKWLRDGSVALGAYSELDGLALPGEAYALLVEFDGRDPVDVVRARLREKKRSDLDDDVLLVLHQHRILVDAT